MVREISCISRTYTLQASRIYGKLTQWYYRALIVSNASQNRSNNTMQDGPLTQENVSTRFHRRLSQMLVYASVPNTHIVEFATDSNWSSTLESLGRNIRPYQQDPPPLRIQFFGCSKAQLLQSHGFQCPNIREHTQEDACTCSACSTLQITSTAWLARNLASALPLCLGFSGTWPATCSYICSHVLRHYFYRSGSALGHLVLRGRQISREAFTPRLLLLSETFHRHSNVETGLRFGWLCSLPMIERCGDGQRHLVAMAPATRCHIATAHMF